MVALARGVLGMLARGLFVVGIVSRGLRLTVWRCRIRSSMLPALVAMVQEKDFAT